MVIFNSVGEPFSSFKYHHRGCLYTHHTIPHHTTPHHTPQHSTPLHSTPLHSAQLIRDVWIITHTHSFIQKWLWYEWTLWRKSISPICNTVQDNAMLHLSCKFVDLFDKTDWIITMLMSFSVTSYVFNEYEDFSQYGWYAIASEILPCYSYPASSLDRHSMRNVQPC